LLTLLRHRFAVEEIVTLRLNYTEMVVILGLLESNDAPPGHTFSFTRRFESRLDLLGQGRIGKLVLNITFIPSIAATMS
jgi:ABC-type uncharacterized transport system permease subunit